MKKSTQSVIIHIVYICFVFITVIIMFSIIAFKSGNLNDMSLMVGIISIILAVISIGYNVKAYYDTFEANEKLFKKSEAIFELLVDVFEKNLKESTEIDEKITITTNEEDLQLLNEKKEEIDKRINDIAIRIPILVDFDTTRNLRQDFLERYKNNVNLDLLGLRMQEFEKILRNYNKRFKQEKDNKSK